MAFRELVEGDCGGPSSLIHLTSHFVRDHGFKEEGIHRPFGPVEPFQASDSDQLVKQFLEENPSCPQTFRMDNLLQEMREIDQNIHPPIAAPGVAQELTGLDTAWANQYLESGRHFNEHHTDDIWNPEIEQNPNILIQQTHELGLGPKWAEEYIEHSIDAIQNDIEKEDTTQAIENNDNPNFAYSKFMKFMKQEGDIPVDSNEESLPDFHTTSDEWTEQFENNNEKSEDKASSNSDQEGEIVDKVEEGEIAVAGRWIDEFQEENVSSEADNYESEFLRLQNEWDKISSSEEILTKHPWLSEYDRFYDPFKEYEFHEENPMKNVPNALEEGKKRLEAGDLPSAILCFEAAVQQNEDDPEAWLLLGKTQAENEQDPLAISALKRCLTLDPTNSAALMALAVSYTNESYQNQACLTLKEWLLKNEKYKYLSVKKTKIDQHPKSSVSSILFDDLHEEVKNLYIQAARMNPREEIDADVQCGLGVLFNLSNEYDKACDCFQAALQVRPNDSRLWNRLGATLANGQKSEEAINAYHRALKLSPGFIRARYNLGISCVNLGAYKEAGEHLLTALNQQAAGRGTQGESFLPKAMSNTIWSTLKLVVSLMHKCNLNEAIESRDLTRLNKEFEII
ncbi:peroxisomal targeting signal 1 receptor [Hylaeus anthracinus]|uniref:peroxisomal targeting signal 1 receptor n=1 Tax=Hylaeus anthracinus TaxID=313031 RepID=UPI0023B92D37|nr:peroxisomal targeting signal 1 receptor [Hylaeus anthracinus]